MATAKKPYKVLFIDLDGTLIKTRSGKTFPEGIWDMEIRTDVLDAIKHIPDNNFVHIVSNQGGIENGYVSEGAFFKKLGYVCACIEYYCHRYSVTCDYCSSNDKDRYNRKPNAGMLQDFNINPWGHERFCKEEMLMVGDASGLPGQFSDSDKKTAENFGIDYMDVEEFIKAYQ